MLNKSVKYWLSLVLVFGLALVIRLVMLSDIPSGFHVDELNSGYIGAKLVQTGTDIYGDNLKLYFNKFGDYRPIGIFLVNGLLNTLF